MKKSKVIFFLLILIGLSIVTTHSIQHPVQPPFTHSLSILFQELGKPIKSVDRAISCILPVDEIDEKMLGDEIKLKLADTTIQEEATIKYLNSLVQCFSDETHKPFEYEVFLVDGPPNACALPGGVICVTTGLIKLLENEAELAAILGHEIGHIERGHLFDAARGEMLLRKITGESHAFYASELLHLMLNFIFSKSQEEEADEYSFRLLVKKQYNPFAISDVFTKLSSSHIHNPQPTSLIDDFFATHPQTELRIEKFYARAQAWIANHPREKWYGGEKNFANRITHTEKDYPDEWRY
ncbi:MAG: M48 family metallopeptidase [Chlamydiales bacterium]